LLRNKARKKSAVLQIDFLCALCAFFAIFAVKKSPQRAQWRPARPAYRQAGAKDAKEKGSAIAIHGSSCYLAHVLATLSRFFFCTS
jgi:hypothetical protein